MKDTFEQFKFILKQWFWTFFLTYAGFTVDTSEEGRAVASVSGIAILTSTTITTRVTAALI